MKLQKAFTLKLTGYVVLVGLVSLWGLSVKDRSLSRQRFPASEVASSCQELLDGLIYDGFVSAETSRRYLEKFKKLSQKESVRARDIDALVEFAAKSFRPSLRDHLSYASLKESLTQEAFAREIIRYGVVDSLLKRGVDIRAPGVLGRFLNSRSAEIIKTSFGALGTPWGIPPLYLPNGTVLTLSDEELRIFLELPFDKAFKKYSEKLGGEELSSVQKRALLFYMREHYMRVASLTSTVLGAYWFYESYYAIEEQTEVLAEINEGAEAMLAGVKYFNDQGVSLDNNEAAALKNARECLFVHDCAQSQGVSKDATDYPEYFAACMDFLKIDGNCQVQ